MPINNFYSYSSKHKVIRIIKSCASGSKWVCLRNRKENMPLFSTLGIMERKLTKYTNGELERGTSAVLGNIRALAKLQSTDSYLVLNYNNFHLQHGRNRLCFNVVLLIIN